MFVDLIWRNLLYIPVERETLFRLSLKVEKSCYIFVAVKLPEPVHPELIPTSVHVPVMVLFVTVPCRVKVSPLGLPDWTVS